MRLACGHRWGWDSKYLYFGAKGRFAFVTFFCEIPFFLEFLEDPVYMVSQDSNIICLIPKLVPFFFFNYSTLLPNKEMFRRLE